jgi:chitinase
MAQAGCTGSIGQFTANADNSSQAEPEECTTTAGYMPNAEINNIVNANVSSSAKSWCDSKTDSNYAVWDSTQWVAGMTEDIKASRKKRLEGLNLAGTIDWTVNLVEYTGDDGKTDGTCSKDPDSIDDCPDEDSPNSPWQARDSSPTGHFDDLSDDTINS